MAKKHQPSTHQRPAHQAATAEPNLALSALAADQRVFTPWAHASLWFSLGVGLLVMQVGAYLVPALGGRDALMVIVLGSVLGSGLLAWVAKIGCDTGLSSAGLMHGTLGRWFARLPVVLNIAQLIGWTTFELVIMRDGTLAVSQQSLGWAPGKWVGVILPTLLWGGVLVALMAFSMVKLVRQALSRYMLPLVVVSLLWLTWQFGTQLQAQGFAAFWSRPGDGSMSFWSAMDLVIAMPVSWLPLVADYARHGLTGRGTLRGTWLGYALANVWCYALGVMVVSVAQPNTDLVAAILLAQGGLLALSLILVDEIDNAYGDVHSGAVSGTSLGGGWSVRQWGVGLAVLCTLLAMVLPMHSLEPFLLTLSSVFVPLYGVILGRLGGGRHGLLSGHSKVEPVAALLWMGGIGFYQLMSFWAPQWGATLPTLVVTGVLAWATCPKSALSLAGR